MGKDLAIWIDEDRIVAWGKHRHVRPLTEDNLFRVNKLLKNLYFSENYRFRPFMGGAFGIVAVREHKGD